MSVDLGATKVGVKNTSMAATKSMKESFHKAPSLRAIVKKIFDIVSLDGEVADVDHTSWLYGCLDHVDTTSLFPQLHYSQKE
ncbi:hypothetical protein CU098_007450 [Rhizopus stolonifer]|uniref:Uncharacterized protein n=1 Tax=Rhizopus stolonifer TaxID=4846 RepID=A0A367KJS9_RHIST|nr:hypothetical protein CU098_007450 [Rhizopus stolonifer]